MKSIFMIANAIKRKINRGFYNSNVYVKYFLDGIVWDNCVFFESFTGQSFQGSCYYIFKEFFSNPQYINYKFYIGAIDADNIKKSLSNKNLIDNRVSVVTRGSTKYAWYLSHCKYIFNNVGFPKEFIKKNEQVYVNTWHGTGPKYGGRKLIANIGAFLLPQRNFMIADYIICPNDHQKRFYIDDCMLPEKYSGKLLPYGFPRNSVFFDKGYQHKIRCVEKLENMTVVFFLPTWRGGEHIKEDLNAIESIDKLAAKLKKSHVFFYRLHPNIAEMNLNLNNCRKVPEKYELYELLCCSDYLITDWSSVYTDYAIKSEHIILYQYDREYMLGKRGLYMDFINNTPFPVVKNIYELEERLLNFGKCSGYETFKSVYCSYDSIDSTISILNTVFANRRMDTIHINIFYVTKILKENIYNKIIQLTKGLDCIFVLPDNLDNEIYEYYNQDYNIKYLTFSVKPLLLKEERKAIELQEPSEIDPLILSAANREIRRQWGNVHVGFLFCEHLCTVPLLLRAVADRVIEYGE